VIKKEICTHALNSMPAGRRETRLRAVKFIQTRGKSIMKNFTCLVAVTFVLSVGDVANAQWKDTFDGSALNTDLWNQILENNATGSIRNGFWELVRPSSANDKGNLDTKLAYEIAPLDGRTLRLNFSFSPASSFANKNGFGFGLRHGDAWNDWNDYIFVQSDWPYNWGGLGATVSNGGVLKKIPSLAGVSGLPGNKWLFEVTRSRAKISYWDSTAGLYQKWLDTDLDNPDDGTSWSIPTSSMGALFFDGSNGLGSDQIEEISLSSDPDWEEDFNRSQINTDLWTNSTVQLAYASISGGSWYGRHDDIYSSITLEANSAYKIAPSQNNTLKAYLDFDPSSSFSKNNMYIGIHNANSGIYLCSDWHYGYGGWGIVIQSNGTFKKSAQLSPLNSLPGKEWLFEVTPGRVKVSYLYNGGYVVYFDSALNAPDGGGTWPIPTVPLGPYVSDQSTNTQNLVLNRVKYGLFPYPVDYVQGNGENNTTINLLSDNKAHSQIVIGNNPSDKVVNAATLLQNTIKAATGVVLPILNEIDWFEGPRLLVGPSGAVSTLGVTVPTDSGVKSEHVIVRRIGKDVVIVGNDSSAFLGSDDAVLEFAKTVLGAEYFYTAPTGKVIPPKSSLSIDALNVDKSPAFARRGLYMYYPAEDVSGVFNEWFRWNHGVGAGVACNHSFGDIIPPDLYWPSHQEYYCEINGQRTISDPYGCWQLCTTNSNVIALTVQFCRNQLNANPDLKYVSIGQNDGGSGMCECSVCSNLDSPDVISRGSRRLITFANEVARQVAQTHPGRGVAMFAYLWSLEPATDMKLESNVVVFLADTQNCLFHDYNDAGCGLAKDAKMRYDAWRQIATNVVVYDYCGFSGGSHGLPFNGAGRVINNANYLRTTGALGYTQDAMFLPGPQGLHYWAGVKATWDTDLTEPAVLSQYCDSLYGSASSKMQDYYTQMKSLSLASGLHSSWVTWDYPTPFPVWTESNIAALQSDINQALSLVSTGSSEYTRVSEQSLLLEYTRAYMNAKNALNTYWTSESSADKQTYLNLRQTFIDAYNQANSQGLISIDSSRLTTGFPTDPSPVRKSMTISKKAASPTTNPLDSTDPLWNIPSQTVNWLVDEKNYDPYPITRAMLTCDDGNLYVKFVCRESNISALKGAATQRDGDVWSDDCVRLSILRSTTRYDFYVSSNGTVRDERDGSTTWNPTWTSFIAKSDVLGKREWNVIIKLPWAAIDLFAPPSSLKINLFRNVTTTGGVTPVQYWVPTFGTLANTARYATVTFASNWAVQNNRDDFTGAAGPLASSPSASLWTTLSGDTAALDGSGNLVQTGAGDGSSITSTTEFNITSDTKFQFKVTDIGNFFGGVAMLFNGAQGLYIRNDIAGFQLWAYDGAGGHSAATFTPVNGALWELRYDPSTQTASAFQNGSLVGTLTGIDFGGDTTAQLHSFQYGGPSVQTTFDNVVAVVAFDAWKQAKFTVQQLAQPSVSGDLSDPDYDGIPNLLEYALGLDPNQTSVSGLPVCSSSGGYLAFTFNRQKSATDITYSVEATDDLGSSWTRIWSSSGVPYGGGGNASEQVTVLDTDSIRSSPTHRRFLRLKITRP
jgi:hypothetical protein